MLLALHLERRGISRYVRSPRTKSDICDENDITLSCHKVRLETSPIHHICTERNLKEVRCKMVKRLEVRLPSIIYQP